MADNEMDKEEKVPQEETTDSKNESDVKTEETPPQKEEPAPRKSIAEAPAAKPEKTKEKDEKKEQQKPKEEVAEEQKHETDDDDKKEEDTGTRKVTFESRDINSVKDLHNGSETKASGAENDVRNADNSETKANNKIPDDEPTVPEKNNTMDLEDVNSDSDSEKQKIDKESTRHNLDSNTNPEVEQKSNVNNSEPEQKRGALESSTSDDNVRDSNASAKIENIKTGSDSEPSQKEENSEPTSGNEDTSEKTEKAEKSETSDSGYVPLDKLWSSPKREFKGVQREYSFEYRRSTSTSSYTAPKEKEEEQAKEKTESDKPKPDIEESQKENNDDSIQTDNNKVSSPIDSREKYVNDRDRSESLDSSDKNEIREKNVKSDNESPREVTDESKKPENSEYHNEPSPKQEKQPESTEISQGEDSERRDEHQMEKRKKDQELKAEQQTEKEEKDEDDWRFDDIKSSDEGSEEARSDDVHIEQDKNRNVEEITIPKAGKDDYEEEKFESESDDNISVEDTTPYREEHKEEPKSEPKKEPAKQSKEPAKKPKSQPKKRPQPSPSPRPSSQPNRNLQRPVAKSAQVTGRASDSRRALSPAQMRTPRSQTNTPRSKQRPQTTPGGPRSHSRIGKKITKKKVKFKTGKKTASEDGQKRQKEFFRAELTRLQKSLKDESSKIHKPKQREHYPFVWTSLEPYYNTYVARFLIDAPEEAIFHPKTRKDFPETERPQTRGRPISRGKLYAEDPQPGYVSRNTAIGLCDPWTDLRMDRELLPRLETPTKKSRTRAMQKDQKPKKKEKPPKQGSTRLPKFPVVDFSSSKENATKRFPYSEVPKFRQEVMGRYKQDAPKKVNSDYSRTRDDFYRMDLDRLDEVHPINRPHMRKAYFAYLQNTPGSKKAINECVKGLNNEQAQKAN